MKRKIRILVVEDEEPIRNGLVDVFIYHGFDVDWAADGPSGLKKAQQGTFDMILLDVMLPGMSGFEVCEKIRATDRDQAIIMLTAKAADEDIIEGLALGADDYVTKPFSIAQLVARVQAVLRRARFNQHLDGMLKLGGEIEIDIRNLSGRCGDRNVAFTRREMDILDYLHAHGERPVPREELLAKVWGYANHLEIETRTVDIHIAKLRRKIEADPSQPRFLVTVRGAGYRLLTA